MSGTLSGTEYIGSGAGNSGTDSGTTIVSGGDEYLGYDSGTGTATDDTVSGGSQYVGYDDGIGYATGTMIDSGRQYVGSGSGATGGATSTTIYTGGYQFVGLVGGIGSATSTTIDGGIQVVGFLGGTGTASTTTVGSGGEQWIGYEGGTGTAISTTIESGGYQALGYYGSGTATSTTIESGGTQYVGYGGPGAATDTIISGGVQYVGYFLQDSGTATSTTILTGGAEYVGYDHGTGTATDTTISTFGTQYVGDLYGTGTATSTTISGGYGVQILGDGSGATGYATSTTIEGGGAQDVGDSGGTGTATFTTIGLGGDEYVGYDDGIGFATSTTIDSGGAQYVGYNSGIGSATDTTIGIDGRQYVGDLSGTGAATSTTIDNGGIQYLGFGSGNSGTATSTTIGIGGGQVLGYDNGTGTATDTTIYSGGGQAVGDQSGTGTATSTTIYDGGNQYVGFYGVGTATDTTIESGGAQFVGYGSGAIGTATGTIIEGGGTQYVGYGSGTGTAIHTTISGGEQIVSSGGTATDDTIYSGGVAHILSGGVVYAPVIDGGTLELAAGASFGTGGVDFAAISGANGGTLDLTGEGSGLTFAPVISGFTGTGDTAASSDIIEVVGVAATDKVVWSQNGASGTLEVETSGGGFLDSMTLEGSYSQSGFLLSDAAGVDQITYDAPCFCFGTRILTENGEVAVEDLAIGDRVVIASGESQPIRWIGHRRVDIARHLRPEWVRPVRIAAGALGDALPARDLCVSPEHALWLQDALIPARDLINGATIRQEAWSRVEYFHLELDSHEILLAEGAAAESYLDCDNRRAFDNAPEGVVNLHPDWSHKAASRPFASPEQTAALRAEFAARAHALGRGGEIEVFDAKQRARGKVTRTNFVRNPRAWGSLLGVLGAGGEAPTHWWLGAPDGIGIEIVGSGQEDGLAFIDLRFAGVTEAGGKGCIHPEPGEAAPARPGQDWTLSCYLRHVGGALDGIHGVNLYIDERGSDGAYLAGQDHPQPLPAADNLALQRLKATRKMTHRDVATTTGYVQIEFAAGLPVDLTLRIAGAQLEQGDYASDLILPPPSEMRPSTRQGRDAGDSLAEARQAG